MGERLHRRCSQGQGTRVSTAEIHVVFSMVPTDMSANKKIQVFKGTEPAWIWAAQSTGYDKSPAEVSTPALRSTTESLLGFSTAQNTWGSTKASAFQRDAGAAGGRGDACGDFVPHLHPTAKGKL